MSGVQEIIAFPYPGGKAKQASNICSAAPASGGIFADVFCGLGNTSWPVPGAANYQCWWLNDTRTADFFHALKIVGDTVAVPEREVAKSAYHFHKSHSKCLRLRCRYEATVLAPYLCHNGAGYHVSGPRSAGGGPSAAAYQRSVRAGHSILLSTNPWITGWDYQQVFASLGPDDFALVDPPYLGVSTGAYHWTDIDHLRLVHCLKRARFHWILCEYWHPLYATAFGEPFWSRRVRRLAHMNAGYRVECMWKNY
jgi:site-specific DNA-adenine methylase